MSFPRVQVVETGGIPDKARQGAGWLANVKLAIVADAAITLSTDNIAGGMVSMPFSTGRNVTCPTGSQLEAAFSGMDVGDTFTFAYMTGVGVGTPVTATGITLAGNATYAAYTRGWVVITKLAANSYEWRIL